VIHRQESGSHNSDRFSVRFYAYCSCGVCGSLRRTREDAEADDRAHNEVCSTQVRKEAA